MRIKYDAQDDILHIEFSKEPITKDVSHGWNVNIGYAADGIAEVTILDARAVMSRSLSKLLGPKISVTAPTRPRYQLADLLAESQEELPRVDGWDEMPAVGREIDL